MTPGRLIILEGPDGAGKSTTSRRLADRLRSAGETVSCFAFPGNEPGSLGKHVHDLHHEPSRHGVARIHETALQVLHAAAHIDAIYTTIRPALERGDTAIMDRFWWSTIVYGRVSGVEHVTLSLLRQLAEHHWSFVVPTAAYVLMGAPKGVPPSQDHIYPLHTAYAEFVESLRVPFPVRVLHSGGADRHYAGQILEDITVHSRPSSA
ncbi:MAG: dTMP kinase [Phycisphaerales bacterium]